MHSPLETEQEGMGILYTTRGFRVDIRTNYPTLRAVRHQNRLGKETLGTSTLALQCTVAYSTEHESST